jgi:hypothetical protein
MGDPLNPRGCIPQVNHTKWRMDNFPDAFLIKLGSLSAGVRVITQPLYIFQYGIYKILTNVRLTPLNVISLNLLEVAQGRASDNDLLTLCRVCSSPQPA